jgi:hypothetical protein
MLLRETIGSGTSACANHHRLARLSSTRGFASGAVATRLVVNSRRIQAFIDDLGSIGKGKAQRKVALTARRQPATA